MDTPSKDSLSNLSTRKLWQILNGNHLSNQQKDHIRKELINRNELEEDSSFKKPH